MISNIVMEMSKRELIRLRDSSEEQEIKRALRFAVQRIEALEGQLREVGVLCKSLQRAIKNNGQSED